MKTEQLNKKEIHEVRLIPLGGLNEIGKNITLLEYRDEIIIIDCGLSFPDDEMYGIDIVIPDFSYLLKNRQKIKGMILTHGHEDHIGAVPYLLKQVKMPIYGTKLTMGLLANKLEEHRIKARLNVVKIGQSIKLGHFKIETMRATHSVADALCLYIDTPAGAIFHTGDFKIDHTPLDEEPMDLQQIAHYGKKGVLLLLADSTNAERKGYTASEQNVGVALENIFRDHGDFRIMVATFSSNVHRVQKIIDTAVMYGRKVAISGRSMLNVVALASEIGYLKIPANTLVDINKIKNISDSQLVIITTGSQGEPMSALSRMASNEHKAVQIRKGDVVILSSSPIPGNEKMISNVVNRLLERGAEVIYSDIADIHVSGHANAEELKLMHALIKPKYFMPVHGEYRQLYQHGVLAESMGMKKNNIFILENGETLSLKKNKVSKMKEKIQCSPTFVDGLGIGDVSNIVLRDRKLLSEGGLFIVVATLDSETGHIIDGPDIISRGFIYANGPNDLEESAKKIVIDRLSKGRRKTTRDLGSVKNAIRNELQTYIYQKTRRNPVILPIFMEV
ncbi:MAG: ribonuclease J [Anaerovoracaceae bacterium]